MSEKNIYEYRLNDRYGDKNKSFLLVPSHENEMNVLSDNN